MNGNCGRCAINAERLRHFFVFEDFYFLFIRGFLCLCKFFTFVISDFSSERISHARYIFSCVESTETSFRMRRVNSLFVSITSAIFYHSYRAALQCHTMCNVILLSFPSTSKNGIEVTLQDRICGFDNELIRTS